MQLRKHNTAEITFLVLALFVLSGSLFPFNMGFYSVGGEEALEASPHFYFQLVLGGFYSVIGILLLSRWRDAIRAARSGPWIVLLLLLACLSIFWSTVPELTLRRSVALLGTNMVGFYLISRYSLEDIADLLTMSFGLVIIVSLALIVFFPQYGINPAPHQGAWRGVFAMKNGAGTYFSLAFLVFLVNASFSEGKKFSISLLGILVSLFLTLKSDSKTALVLLFALIAAFIFLGFFVSDARRARKIWAVAAIVVIALTLWVGYSRVSNEQHDDTQQTQVDDGSFSSSFFETLNRYKTLTGRTVIWSEVIDKAAQHPLVGYGYIGHIWPNNIGMPYSQIRETIRQKLNFYVNHSHNGYVHLFLALGGAGIVLLILAISAVIKDWLICAVTRGIEYSTMLTGLFLLWFLAYNLTDTLIIIQNVIYWPLFILVAVHLRWQKMKQRTTTATVGQEA